MTPSPSDADIISGSPLTCNLSPLRDPFAVAMPNRFRRRAEVLRRREEVGVRRRERRRG